MECIESKFKIFPCGCKFLIRDNDVLMVEFGKDCKDPSHNPSIECGHEIKSWEYTPHDVADLIVTREQYDNQKINCMLCGLEL